MLAGSSISLRSFSSSSRDVVVVSGRREGNLSPRAREMVRVVDVSVSSFSPIRSSRGKVRILGVRASYML